MLNSVGSKQTHHPRSNQSEPKMRENKILITGGVGFIGSELVRQLIRYSPHYIYNIDSLTYASNLNSLANIATSPRYTFREANICDKSAVSTIFSEFQPDAVIHLAAESHVDRSINGPGQFIETNVVGTYSMLDVATKFWRQQTTEKKNDFRFIHVSTDEVFGSLGPEGKFNEVSPYDPRSPYSASKASSDHLVRAWYHTYGFPIIVTNCSNNYGPYQHPEKLIPLAIAKGLQDSAIPIYGTGMNIRDWLYVADHAAALRLVLDRGEVGQTYCIGGDSERTNLSVAEEICSALDAKLPRKNGDSYRSLIKFVADRPGHDHRYAIDFTKIKTELGWSPKQTFKQGIAITVDWYLQNTSWLKTIQQKLG